MMFARSIKTSAELDLLRRATKLNQTAIGKTVASWEKGATWRDLNIAYARSVAELGGFVRDPGGMVWGHPRGTEQTIMLSTAFEDTEAEAGTRAPTQPAATGCSPASTQNRTPPALAQSAPWRTSRTFRRHTPPHRSSDHAERRRRRALRRRSRVPDV